MRNFNQYLSEPNKSKKREGNTNFFIPENTISPPKSTRIPVFYNPLGEFKRDVMVTIVKTINRKNNNSMNFADALSGIGIGAIRVANESNVDRIFINDLNKKSLEFANLNVSINNLQDKSYISNLEAKHFLMSHGKSEQRFDFIEIDPFGCPSEFIDSAIQSININGVISLTATDGPVLCGIYPKVSLKKYGGYSLNTEYSSEIGVRLMYGSLASSALRYNLGICPLFSHTNKHYSKIYSQITHKYTRTLDNIGFLSHCFNCGYRQLAEAIIFSCTLCESNLRYAGPLWTGELFDAGIISDCTSLSNTPKETKLFDTSILECSIAEPFYVSDNITNILKKSSLPLFEIIEKMSNSGFKSSPTIFNPNGFRTEANIDEIKRLLN